MSATYSVIEALADEDLYVVASFGMIRVIRKLHIVSVVELEEAVRDGRGIISLSARNIAVLREEDAALYIIRPFGEAACAVCCRR